MSTVVDERVVSMQFDNKHFERNVSETMGTLAKLKQSLNLSGATKGLEEVNAISKRTDLSTVSAGIETVKAKFSAMQIIGITALQSITNTAINTGKRIVSSLTIDPIKTGLSEYETQLNAIQTILANTESKGSTLEDVNAALDELNTYADKTIYNFTEMTRNIGTFTAAGVDLDTSVSAIKGIANLAAVSGSTSQQASTAMYQLSQALASGTVKLMDWNSVVNAGMGGQVFQDALKETARVHGVAIDDIIEKQGSFRESLSEGWLSSEILTETLSKFTGDLNEEQLKSMGYTEEQIKEIMKLGQTANDAATKVKTFTQLMDTLREAAQSGWAQTWRLVIGDFEEAKSLWTGVSDVLGGYINDMNESRNELLSGTLNSGWDKLMDAGIMDEEGYTKHLKDVAKEHGVSLDEMIEKEGSLEKALRKGFETGDITSDMFSESLNRLSEAYAGCSDEELKSLGYTQEQIDALNKLNKQVQNGEVSMEGFTDQMQKLSGRELIIESFSNVWKALLSVIKPIKEAFREIFPATTAQQLYKVIEAIKDFTAKLILSDENADKLKRTFKGLFAVVDIVVTVVKTLASAAFRVIGSIAGIGGSVLGATASIGDFLLKIRNSVKESGSFANVVKTITDGIVNFVSTVKEKIDSSSLFGGLLKVLKVVWNTVKTIFSQIGNLIGGAFDSFGDGGGTIFDIINAILAGGLTVKLISFIKSFKDVASGFDGFMDMLKAPFKGIGEIFDSVKDSLSAFQDKLKADAIKSLAISIGILAAAMLVLSLIPKENLINAMSAIALSMGTLIGAYALISKIDKKGIVGAKTMIALSASLLILSFALKNLGSMEWPEIGRGLVAMVGTLAILMGALTLMSLIAKIGKASGAKQLLKIVIPLSILAMTLKSLGNMEWPEIGKGLTAMAGTLVILMGALALVSLIGKIGKASGAKQLLTISISLLAVAGSLKIMGSMSWDEIKRGLAAMGGALGILTGVLALMALITKIGKQSGAMQIAVIANSLLLITASLKVLATMDWDEIKRGLGAMGGALGIIVGVLALMALISKISGGGALLVSAAAIVIISGALVVLTGVLAVLGNMDIKTIITGLGAIAGVFIIIGVAGVLLQAAVPAILALSASLIALGVAITLIGAGVFLIGTGIAALVTSITAGGALIVSTLLSLVRGAIELIPLLLTSIAEGIVAFAAVIVEGAPTIGQAFASLLLSAIDACVQVIPALASGLLKIVVGVLDALVEFTPQIVSTLVDLLIGILESLVTFLPKLIQTAVKVFAQFFDGVVDALKNVDPDQLLKTVLSIGIIAGLMLALSAISGLIPGAMLGVLGMGVVIAELALVLAAIGKLASIPGLKDLIADGGNLLQSIGTAIGQFIGGIIGGVAQGFTSSLPAIGSDLSAFMKNLTPFINGIKLIDSSVLDNAKTLAALILTVTATSIVERMTSWLTGGNSMKDFATEIAAFGKGIKQFADEVAGIDGGTVKAAAEAGKTLGQMAKAIPTKGGLWDIIAGENDLEDFGNQLGGFGAGVKQFADEVKGINGSSVKSAAEAGKTLGTMASKLSTKGGLWSAKEDKMTKFASNLSDFATAVKNFVSEMSAVGDVGVVTAKVTALNECLKSISTSGVKGMTESLNGAKSKVAKLASDMVQAAINAVKKKYNAFGTAGKNLMKKFLEAVKSYKSKVKKAFSDMAGVAASSVKSSTNYTKCYDAGKYLVGGLANGIENNSYKAINKATALATAVTTAIDKAFRINSPSKETYADGESLIEGLTKSLDDNGKEAYNSSYNMAKKVVKGVSNAISKARDLIENGVDSQPTIRPLVDLSEVTKGASAINGMLSLNPSVGVLSTVGSIGSSMNKIQNGSDNTDIISAIKGLSDKLDNASNSNVYNINGITYDDGSGIQSAVETLIRAAKIGRRT